VAVRAREAGGQNPAVFLVEVRLGVRQEGLVQRQLRVGRRAQQGVELLDELGVGFVHPAIAGVQFGGPGQGGGGGCGGGGHGARG